MGSIPKAIAAFAREHGVEIATDSEVAEIEIQDRSATGVRTVDGRRYRADIILSNADPTRTFLGMVGESHLPAEFADGVKRIKVKGSVVKVLMALGELPDFTAMPGTTIGPQHTGGIVINPRSITSRPPGTTASAAIPAAARSWIATSRPRLRRISPRRASTP